MKRIVTILLMLVMSAPATARAQIYESCFSVVGPARAQADAGINLALNDCGAFGTQIANTNCASNSGIAMAMVISVVPPPGIDRMVAFEGFMDAVTAEPALSPWWTLDGCRSTALNFGFDFTAGPFNCNDFWAGQAVGGGGVSPVHVAPNRFRIKLVCATPFETPIDPALEHYLAKVNILRAKSTGSGSCAGCEVGACLLLDHVLLEQPAGVGDYLVSTPIRTNIVQYGGGAIVPTQNRTWGQIKAAYR